MSGVEIKMHPGFYRRIKKRYEKYQMETGILQNDVHLPPVYVSPLGHGEKADGKRLANPFTTVAGGTARKIDRQSRAKNLPTLAEVFIDVQQKTNINVLREPFRAKGNRDLLRMLDQFFKLVGSSTKVTRRLENALQAVVRNPITRGEYGKNSRATESTKGFNRLLIDTGQIFNAIKARVIQGKRGSK